MKKILKWSGVVVGCLVLLIFGFNYFFSDKAINHLKAKQAKSHEIIQSSKEVIRYADCIVAAETDEARKACDEMADTFSDATKAKMKKQGLR